MTAQEVYVTSVRFLPQSERLRLASMILQDLSATSAAAHDIRETLSEEDMQELARASLRFAEQDFPTLDEREE